MRFLLSIWMLFTSLVVFAQDNIAIQDLLDEAELKLYVKPQESGKIAEYILSQKESTIVNAEAMLLLAKSFYIRGNYNQATKNGLEARKIAEDSNDISIKVKTSFFVIQLLRELNLETVAENYLLVLHVSKKEIRDENLLLWYAGKMKQDSAFANFKKGNFPKASQLLSQAKSIFVKNNDSVAINEINLSLSEVNLKTARLDSAKIYLEKTLAEIQQKGNNDFQKLKVLHTFGSLYFLEKEYDKSLDYFQQALANSLKLPNKYFENKAAEGLALNYLALEDAHNFYLNKQLTNSATTEVENDRNLAVNTVYNFINYNQKELSEKKIQEEFAWVYGLAGLFFLLLMGGIIINYFYASKTRQYKAIWKYIQPKEPILETNLAKEELEKSSIVPEETEQIILQKLNKFEAGKKFTNPDMSIALLASQFDTNTKYLSEVINRQKGRNFNSYINELRINYIIEKLKTDSVYFNYKISYLAEECGFSSHSSFATVFKSVTGISPTKFMEFLQKRKETA